MGSVARKSTKNAVAQCSTSPLATMRSFITAFSTRSLCTPSFPAKHRAVAARSTAEHVAKVNLLDDGPRGPWCRMSQDSQQAHDVLVTRLLLCTQRLKRDHRLLSNVGRSRTHRNFGAAWLVVEVQRAQQLNQRVLQRPDEERPPPAQQ